MLVWALDRMEPSQLGVRPAEVTFWRPTNETLARHRCPLCDPSLGLEPWCVSFTVDLLHASCGRDGFLLSRWIVVADARRRMGQARHARRDCRFGYALHCSRTGRMAEEEAYHTSFGAPGALTCPEEAWRCFSPRVQKQGHLAGRSFVSAPQIGEISHTQMAEAGPGVLDMVDILNAHGWSLPHAAVADAFRHHHGRSQRSATLACTPIGLMRACIGS